MRTSRLITLLLLLVSVAGCQTRNPAEISAEKQGEAVSPNQDSAAPAPARPRLVDGSAVTSVASVSEGVVKLDLRSALQAGEVQLEVNDPSLQKGIDVLVDGEVGNVVRSEDVNPVILTFTFTAPVRLRGAGVHSTYSTFDWVLETRPGEERLLVSAAPPGTWSIIELDSPEETTVVRLEVLRLERDNFVHLNEVEIYTSPE